MAESPRSVVNEDDTELGAGQMSRRLEVHDQMSIMNLWSTNREVSLADEEGVKAVLVNPSSAWGCSQQPHRACSPPDVTATVCDHFGSARVQAARSVTKRPEAAAALAALGCDIITGGGPGLMQAD